MFDILVIFANRNLFIQYKTSRGKTIEYEKIRPPAKGLVVSYGKCNCAVMLGLTSAPDDLPVCPTSQIKSLASKLCVLKLNGGLGTTMGCSGPKSVIEVHTNMSFLDLTVHQLQVINLPH